MSKELSKQGCTLIKKAICELLKQQPGLKRIEIAEHLGLESSDPDGNQRGWLCYGFLQVLQCEGLIKKTDSRYYL